MREETGRGETGERAPPTTRAPGAARIPAPPWTAHSAGGRAARERGSEVGERDAGAQAHTRGDPQARPLEAEVGTRVPEPKAEELALRQGIWDAGGERRLHKEKAALVRGETREAEAEGQEENETGGRERRSQGQTGDGRGGEGVKAGSRLSATGVGWRRQSWRPELLLGSSSNATRLLRGGKAERGWEAKDGEGSIKERN